MINRLRANDLHRTEAMLVIFEIAFKLGQVEVLLGLAQLMQRGDRAEREKALGFYAEMALASLRDGQRDTAVKFMREAMQGMADQRAVFEKDPQLADLLKSI